MKPITAEGLIAIYGETEAIGTPRSLLRGIISDKMLDMLFTTAPEPVKVVAPPKKKKKKKKRVWAGWGYITVGK